MGSTHGSSYPWILFCVALSLEPANVLEPFGRWQSRNDAADWESSVIYISLKQQANGL
jgi:hypothetical protein